MLPIIAIYEQQLSEKDEKLKLMKTKIEDLTAKFRELIEENNQLQKKVEKLPEDSKNEMYEMCYGFLLNKY